MKLCTVCSVLTSRAGSRCNDHARQSNRSRHNALYNTRAWQRCLPCHSGNPTYEGITAPPLGVTFETLEEVQAQALRIEQMAVILKVMPPGNVTGITEEERETLGAWILQGAKP